MYNIIEVKSRQLNGWLKENYVKKHKATTTTTSSTTT